MNKFAAITSFLGSVKNRFMTYQEDRSIGEKLEMASRIAKLDGVELCYPGDFDDPAKTRELIDRYSLGVSAINFRSRRTGTWWRGSFISESERERRELVDDLRRAMDISREIGCSMVTTCPLNEGSDYLFEMDYAKAYDSFAETMSAAAIHDESVKIALEYKLNDPRARSILGTAGETLAFCLMVGRPNVGVTLDIGHSLYAGERPAQSVVLLAKAGRLFYVHLNDNDKFWDWDMIPGAYNFWDFIEFFFFLKRVEYRGWFGFDVFAKEIDTVRTYDVSLVTTTKLLEVTARIDEGKMAEILSKRDPTETMAYLYSLI